MGNRKKPYQSITIYKDMAPQVLELEKEEAGEIFQAIMRYAVNGEDTDLSQYDRFVRSLWKTIKLKLDAGDAQDKQKSETNRQNALKRWGNDANAYDGIQSNGNDANAYDGIQSNGNDANAYDGTTITDTDTETISSTTTNSFTVTKTNTEQSTPVPDSDCRHSASATAKSAEPHDADLFSVKQLRASVKRNKIDLTDEGIQEFYDSMHSSKWLLYGKPIEKRYISRAMREWAKKHPQYSTKFDEPDPEILVEESEEEREPTVEEAIQLVEEIYGKGALGEWKPTEAELQEIIKQGK